MTEKVTISKTEVGAAKPAPTVTDAKGRVLTLVEPDVLAPYRLVRIVGAEAAENRVYTNMIFPLLYLKKIDDEDMIPFQTIREVEALIQRLGHDGVRKLRAGVEQHFSGGDEKEDNAAIKK
jgi:hypothetical protein